METTEFLATLLDILDETGAKKVKVVTNEQNHAVVHADAVESDALARIYEELIAKGHEVKIVPNQWYLVIAVWAVQ